MSKALSPRMLAATARYAAARKAGAGAGLAQPVADFIAATQDQSPAAIADADGAIAWATGLWGAPQKLTWFERRVLGQLDDHDLLDTVPGLPLLFMFHKNGFLRQAALERISDPIPNAFLVAALVWRRNDWVSQVRASAQTCMDRCLPLTRPEVLSGFFLDTALARSTWRRWSDADKALLDQYSARPAVARGIVAQLLLQRNGPLPSRLRRLLHAEWIDPWLETLALEAKVPGVRAIAIQALANGHVRWTDGFGERFWIDKPMGIAGWRPRIRQRALTIAYDRGAIIRAGLRDRSAPVRKVALAAIIDQCLSDSELTALAQPFLNDRSASIRSKAAFIVERAVQADGTQGPLPFAQTPRD